jgi:hypothetical protein
MAHAISDQRATEPTERRSADGVRVFERLHRFLDKLGGSGFFGKITISFQNGKVHDIKIEQTRKLEEL